MVSYFGKAPNPTPTRSRSRIPAAQTSSPAPLDPAPFNDLLLLQVGVGERGARFPMARALGARAKWLDQPGEPPGRVGSGMGSPGGAMGTGLG